jgi:hypothetical protein
MNRQKMNRITSGLLLLGLGGALAIYLTAAPEVVDPLLGDPMANKKYMRELRVMGGQGNVLAAEFQDWFGGLWQGRELAGTVAVITVGVVLVFRFVATFPPAAPAETVAAPEKKTPSGKK